MMGQLEVGMIYSRQGPSFLGTPGCALVCALNTTGRAHIQSLDQSAVNAAALNNKRDISRLYSKVVQSGYYHRDLNKELGNKNY